LAKKVPGSGQAAPGKPVLQLMERIAAGTIPTVAKCRQDLDYGLVF
jgi:hypothetical protein